ncbi:CHAT domain-containing protein [bacterium]|nr:CHAT domain-containing protein [bacterium]
MISHPAGMSPLAWAATLVALLAVAASAAPTNDPGPGERAWLALVAGDRPAPAPADAAPRWRWVSGDLAVLRELEDTDPDGALARYVELGEEAVAAGDEAMRLLTLERRAALELAAHRADAARELLEEALPLAERLDQPLTALRCRLDLGRVLLRTREVAAAADHLDAVADSPLAPVLWRASATLARSVVARLSMDLDAALDLRERAYALYTEADDTAGRAQALHFIGTTHAMRGELTRAMVRLEHAERLARESGRQGVLAGCLGDQAGILYLIGDLEAARAQYREASDLTADPRRRGWYLTNLASILAFQGRHDEAVPRYGEALAMVRATGDRRTESTILLALGLSRCAVGDIATGLDDLDRALAHAEEYGLPMDAAKALEVKGYALLDEGRLDEAGPLLREAIARADPLAYFDVQEWARSGLAEVARRRGDLAGAERLLEEAIAIVEQVRRRSGGSAEVQRGYFSQVGRSFDALVAVLHERHERDPDRGHGERAWEIAQRGRARSLLDLLAEAEVDLRVRADRSFREREEAVLAGIASLEERRQAAPDSADALAAEIRRLESRLTVLEAELRRADPRYAELRYPAPIDLVTLRDEVLAPGEALLEYQLGERQSHVWLIADDRFEFHRLPARAEIERLVADLRPLLHDPSLTGAAAAWYADPARALAQAILDPLGPVLEDVERLIVVPDGALHYVPLAALPLDDTSDGRYHELPWLAVATEVVRTPSASALARLRALEPVPRDASPLLMLADPAMPDPARASVFVRVAGADALEPVPAARAEQDRLVALYGRQARWWAGAAATAGKLATEPRGGAWRSVHLITHGVFNEDRPRYSGLVLAPTDGDDGFVDVAEIFALDLPCEQVVLSACSSALGESIDGEGLVGFVHGFLYAGARSVVAALWDVGGEGAARFMGDYHARLVGDPHASRAAALTATRRSLATSPAVTSGGVPVAHPAVWAAFVAAGDGR